MAVKANLKLVVTATNNRDFYRQIGKNIQYFRKIKGLKQTDIAAKVGVSPQQVQKYESGQGSVYTHMLVSICHVLDITMSELLSFKSTESTEENVNEKRFARMGIGDKSEF